VSGCGEHALVLRSFDKLRINSTRASLAAQHKGYRKVVAACGSWVGFLLDWVAVSLGQSLRRHVGVAFTGKTAGAHPEEPCEIEEKHRSTAQQRLHPMMDKRRASTPVCVVLCLSARRHLCNSCLLLLCAEDYTAVHRPLGQMASVFFLERWNCCGDFLRPPAKLWGGGQIYPTVLAVSAGSRAARHSRESLEPRGAGL
jgi:hypothetical protein